MKAIVFLVAALVAVCSGELDQRCGWGPSYWCSGLDKANTCGAFNHCTATVWSSQQLKEDGSDNCIFCKAIVDDMRRFLDNGKTEAEIAEFLSSACAIIPESSASGKCKELADSDIKQIIHLISKKADAQMICSLLTVCSGLQDNVLHSPVVKPDVPPPIKPLAPSAERKLSPLMGVRDEPICTDCKKFFNDIKQMMTSNKTEAEVEMMIDQILCSELGAMEEECKSLVHEYIPEIMELLSTFYDPDLVCQSLGVCSSNKPEVRYGLLLSRLRKTPLYKVAASQNSVESCLMCKAVMTELQSLDRNKAVQAKILAMVKTQLCARMGSVKDMCNLAVDQYSAEIFELLVTILEPTSRCRFLGFCDASVAASGSMKPALPLTPAKNPAETSANPQCMMCELVVREVKQYISDNATEKEIMDAMEKVCSILPEELGRQCRDFIDTYGKAVIEMLVKDVDPVVICTYIGLCEKPNSVVVPVKTRPAMPLTPAKQPTSGASEVENDPSPECIICEFIMKEVKEYIDNNSTEQEIMQALEKVCNIMPSTVRKDCLNFVDTYGPMVIELLIKEVDPEFVCREMGLCKATKQSESPIKPPIVPVGNSETCAVCETVVQYLEALLDQGSTMEQIEAMLDKLCGYLPSSLVQECDNLVKQYGDLIIHYISTMASPKEVCKLVGVCDNTLLHKTSAGVSGINRVRVARETSGRIEHEERVLEKPEIQKRAPLLGQNECTWGPSHYCSSEDVARKCNVVEYCKEYRKKLEN